MASRVALSIVTIALLAAPAFGWERLVTRTGAEIEGDITQSEFVMTDATGGEVIIPRAAILKLEASGEELTASIKDGTEIRGALVDPIEIEDGMIRRRYEGSAIQLVEFDRFIEVEPATLYHSCPIRVSLDASQILGSESADESSTAPGAINCKGVKIVSLAWNQHGEVRTGKTTKISAKAHVLVPKGADQLVDFSLQLVQGETVIDSGSQRATIAGGAVYPLKLQLRFRGEELAAAGPAPQLRAQLVNQDAAIEVSRGNFFWWFTIPIPL